MESVIFPFRPTSAYATIPGDKVKELLTARAARLRAIGARRRQAADALKDLPPSQEDTGAYTSNINSRKSSLIEKAVSDEQLAERLEFAAAWTDVSKTYTFAFGDIGSVLGIGWTE